MGQNAPVLGHTLALKSTPMLACHAIGPRLRVGPDAFGNALGQSVVDASSSPGYSAEEMAGDCQRENNTFASAAEASGGGALESWGMGQVDYSLATAGRARLGTGSIDPGASDLQAAFRQSERDYRQATDTGAIVRRGDTLKRLSGGNKEMMGRYAAGMGLRDMNQLRVGQSMVADWSISPEEAVASSNRFYVADARVKAAAAQAASLTDKDGMGIGPTVERAQAMGLYGGGGRAPAAATVDPFNLVTPDYYVEAGLVSRYYQGQVALFSDSNQPWYVRSLSFVNATLAAPVMLFEEGGRGIMNVPYAGSQVGQHAAIFNQATDVDTKVIAGLSVVKFGSEGLVNAYAGGVLGRRVYVQAQDEAVSFWLKQQFDGDIRKFNEVYTSAVDGTRRLGYSFNGVSGYRAANTAEEALSGRYLSLERPASPAAAIEGSALNPRWGNQAGELYEVSTRSGFYYKGQVAPQSGWYQGNYFNLGGGNTQVFMPALKVDGEWISPIVSGKKVPYGG